MGISTEVVAAEHLHQGVEARHGAQAPAAQQLLGGFPVIVPATLTLEGIDPIRCRPPTAEVVNRFAQGAAVAAAHIPDHPINVEDQDGPGAGGGAQGREAAADRFDV